MVEPTKGKGKLLFPPALLGINAGAMIGIGISFAELFPKHGRPLGLVSADLAWPLLWVSVAVAAFTTYKMIRIIRRHNQENTTDPPDATK